MMDSRRFKILYKVSVIVLAVLATLLLSSFILMILGADIFRTFYAPSRFASSPWVSPSRTAPES